MRYLALLLATSFALVACDTVEPNQPEGEQFVPCEFFPDIPETSPACLNPNPGDDDTGDTGDTGDNAGTPVSSVTLNCPSSVSAGQEFACAIRTNADASQVTWSLNGDGAAFNANTARRVGDNYWIQDIFAPACGGFSNQYFLEAQASAGAAIRTSDTVAIEKDDSCEGGGYTPPSNVDAVFLFPSNPQPQSVDVSFLVSGTQLTRSEIVMPISAESYPHAVDYDLDLGNDEDGDEAVFGSKGDGIIPAAGVRFAHITNASGYTLAFGYHAEGSTGGRVRNVGLLLLFEDGGDRPTRVLEVLLD